MNHEINIFIGSDYKGYDLKSKVKTLIPPSHSFVKITDCGVDSKESPSDYNDQAIEVCKKVLANPDSFGVLICGSGHGMNIQANRIKGIRACNCASTDSAKLAREHENANVICLSSELLSPEEVGHILYVFFHTRYSKIPRREQRISRLDEDISQ